MQKFATLFSIFAAVFLFSVGNLQAIPEGKKITDLQKKVSSLQLGFGEYYIAHKLTAEQKSEGEKDLQEKSYPGTYTFTDEGIHVLVEKKSDTILAIYLKNEEADKEHLKQMIANLMMQFGNPTREAHDQIIYWAYNETGKISENQYADLKKDGNIPVIATVKFKSKLTFSEAGEENAPPNSIHCIVSSPRMLETFYNQ